MTRPVALVTGGTRGIGLGCARHLAAAGFDLALGGVRDEAQIGDALEQVRASSAARVVYCRGDVGSPADRTAILDRVRAELGSLHVLVNNAGVAPKQRKDLLETTAESFEHVIRTNLEGPFFLSQLAARWLVEQKQRTPDEFFAIVNIGSISATVASTNRGEYCVAKAGVAMTTALFAARLGEHGIPVYEVRPGVTRTDMTAGVADKYDELIEGGLCVTPRWGTPDDVGKAVATLATGTLPYSTGQVILVDGGLTLPRL